MQDQQAAMSDNQSAMGDAFNDALNDDSFYLPPEIFDNEDFKRGMESFISPDGHAVRFIISHEGDPLSADGIERIDAIKQAAKESIKGTPLEGSKVYLAGTAATYKDMRDEEFWHEMAKEIWVYEDGRAEGLSRNEVLDVIATEFNRPKDLMEYETEAEDELEDEQILL